MKKLFSGIIIVIIWCLLSTKVQAVSNFDARLNKNSNEIKIGNNVVVTLRFDQYEDISKGINSFKATLDYDENIFEEVLQSDFMPLNDWEELKFNKDTKQFVAIKKAGTINPEDIVKINFKVKSNASEGETNIKIKDIVSSEGRVDITSRGEGVANTKINIIKEQDENKNNFDDAVSSNKENDKNVLNEPNTKIPKTGINIFITFIPIIVELLIVFAIIAKINENKVDKKIKNKTKLLMSILFTVIVSMQLIGTIHAAISKWESKGELNGDGNINYIDVNLLELHLIHTKNLSEDRLENADMNSDGKITVTDLSLLVQKIENNLDYQISLSNVELDNYYPNKNEEITLKFFADVNYEATIKKVVINGIEYSAEKIDGSEREYQVNVQTGGIAGIKSYHFTEVLLHNGKRKNVDYTVQVDVLKQVPTIENYKIDENINDSKVYIFFEVKDEDESITSSQILVVDENENEIKSQALQTGNNNIEVDVVDGKNYNINFSIIYDLDTNKLDNYDEDHTGELVLDKKFKFAIDYDFNISNIKTYKNDSNTNTFEKDEIIQIRFKSSNLTTHEPATIKVNNKEYYVIKNGEVYIANIEGIQNIGNSELIIEEIILDNGKSFVLEKENILTVNITKKKPIIKDFLAEENVEANNINIKFKVNDEDNTIKKLLIILYDNEGNKISEKEVNGIEIEEILNTQITSNYNVKVIASYNLIDGEDIDNQVLFETNIIAKPRANIKQGFVDNEYLEKEQVVTITYNIETNKNEDITKVFVNNLECIAKKISDNQYEVKYNVGNNYGIKELNTTKLIYADETEATVNDTIKIEVLKDKPIVNYIKQDDDIDNSKVSVQFEIIDEDNSFISGKAILTKNSDGTKQEQNLELGINSIQFTVIESELYTLEIKVSYDRDTNTLEEKDPLDNRVVDEIAETKVIELIADYELTINNLQTFFEETSTNYFNKNNSIILKFESNNSSIFEPEKVIVGEQEYELTKKGNKNIFEINGFDECGLKEITIEKIVLNNEITLEVSENNSVNIEVLKDEPNISEFNYIENDNNEIEINLSLNDNDNSVSAGKIVIIDELGNEIKVQDLEKNANTVIFEKNSSESYTVKIIVDYDLDSNILENNKNEYKNKVLVIEELDISERMIEMKDIENITLYKKSNESVEEVSSVNIVDLDNLDNYLIKVDMKYLPSFYSKIKSYNTGEKLSFILDCDNVVQYEDNQKHNWLEVDYGVIENGIASKANLKDLIQKINENPAGNYNITSDLDASEFTTGNYIFTQEFTGTINGNGHKIKNLSRPLFQALTGATIENLIIENSTVSTNGTIANSMSGTILRNVHITESKITAPNEGGTGIFVGIATEKSLIECCSSTQVNIIGRKRTGGMIGMLQNSTIKNCYITGNMSSTSDGSGALTGQAQNGAIIENCYANVVTNFSGTRGNIGGITGYTSGTAVIMNNNLSLCTALIDGHGYCVYGNGINALSANNYQLESSNMILNNHNSISNIDLEKLKSNEFYIENLKWSSDVWSFDKVQNGIYPTLKNADPNYYKNQKMVPQNPSLYIPDYSRISNLEHYDQSKEILYHNLNKLIPFYDAKYLVMDGEKVFQSDILNTKVIKAILPISDNNELVTYLTHNDCRKIKKIKILFTDDTISEYELEYKENKGNVASYTIKDLGLMYNYNKFIIKSDASIILKLKNHINNIDYETDLDTLTSESDSRLYKDYYNEKIKSKSLEIIMQLLENNDNYTVTMENDVLNTILETDLIKTDKFNKMLYSYNYYKRWYTIDIERIDVADLILFHGDIFDDSMTTKNMLNEVLIGNRNTSATNTFYASNIAKYSKKADIGSFLDYIITTIGEYQDSNDWFTQNYQGLVYEIPAENHPEVEYRAWRQLKRRNNFLLPFITLPENSAYIISSPTQFLVGAQRVYISDPSDDTQKAILMDKMQKYGVQISNFYTITAGFIEADRLNSFTDIQVDRRTTVDGVYQTGGTTQEPFHKNFNEAVGYWAAANGSAAYANGNNVYWNAYQALNSFSTWSHESGHNQDSKVFLKGCGRRPGVGAEDYADGNTTQGGGDGGMNFNLSYEYDMDSNVTTNLTPQRINSNDNIYSYYKGMFETLDFLNYAEAKAFLRLNPEEQSKVGVQVFYPNEEVEGFSEDNINASTYSTTGWRVLSANQFEDMNLNTVEDLYDNRIIIKPGVTGQSTMTGVFPGKYGAEGIYTRRWYQPHNDYGRPDSYTIKRLAWEMLGIGGYDGGYINYYSGRSKNDLEAIRKVTGDDTMTWKKYKQNRYELIQSKWNSMQYINSDKLEEQFLQALKADAKNEDRNVTSSTNVMRINYHHLKRATNDFNSDIFGNPEVTHIKTAEEFKTCIEEKPYGYFVLDNDIDVSNLTGNNAIIENPFFGTLNGQSNKISGNTLPLFSKLHYAHILNLTIEGSTISANQNSIGTLSKIANNCNIENVIGKDIQISKLSNISEVGGIIGNCTASTINNTHTIDTTIEATTKAGLLIGYGNGMVIEECSSNGSIIAIQDAIGGLIGQLDSSSIQNSYSLGEVKGRQNVGGFIGYANNSTIESCFSACKTETTNVGAGGGFVGQIASNSRVKNNISFGRAINCYKFDGRSIDSQFGENYNNNYEYEEVTGNSTLNRANIDFTNKIILATTDDISNTEFYTNTLKWNLTKWNFDNIMQGGVPKLKNSGIDNSIQIIEKIELRTVEDFIKIEEAPDQIYSITQDIDFSNYEPTAETIITQTFTGRIEGNGHKLSNLNGSALFANFRGEVKDLKLENFTNEKPNKDFVAVFTQNSYGAVFTNIKLKNIILKGKNNVAPITGMDGREGANSIFERISIENADVVGSGVYVSTFIGRKYGGRIKNCYVQGNLECYTTECAGIVGALHQTVRIENVISNVDINRPRSTDSRNNNGGFVGNIINESSLLNCISMGDMTGFTFNETETNVSKFAGCSEEKIVNCLQNCYEITEKQGTSNVTINTKGNLDTIKKENLKNKNFYKDTLHFDETVWNLELISSMGYPLLK